MGGPITFQLDGEQYIATLAGLGGVAMSGALAGGGQQRSEFGRVVAFKIGGKSELPPLQPKMSRVIPDLRRANATGDAEAGQRHYDRVCAACHGAGVRSVTSVPDLRYSPAIADAATFKTIVIDGACGERNGGFASVLTPADAEAALTSCTWLASKQRGESQPTLTLRFSYFGSEPIRCRSTACWHRHC